jgi:hypothetical protein
MLALLGWYLGGAALGGLIGATAVIAYWICKGVLKMLIRGVKRSLSARP